MRSYVCDWCHRPKKDGERWILGFAAERIGAMGLRREISIAAAWSDGFAEHPLAVHFCSEDHKQSYVAALFKNTEIPSRSRRRAAIRRESGAAQAALSARAGIGADERPRSPRTENTERAGARRGSAAQQFTAIDKIRSHGLSVRLGGRRKPQADIIADHSCRGS